MILIQRKTPEEIKKYLKLEGKWSVEELDRLEQRLIFDGGYGSWKPSIEKINAREMVWDLLKEDMNEEQ